MIVSDSDCDSDIVCIQLYDIQDEIICVSSMYLHFFINKCLIQWCTEARVEVSRLLVE